LGPGDVMISPLALAPLDAGVVDVRTVRQRVYRPSVTGARQAHSHCDSVPFKPAELWQLA